MSVCVCDRAKAYPAWRLGCVYVCVCVCMCVYVCVCVRASEQSLPRLGTLLLRVFSLREASVY